jgi:rSAM/selenodomain-associated transferase 2
MTVSVIIPTLNEESCLADTIRSVRALQPLEIIVVDGGSSDGTAAAAAGADAFLCAPRGRAVQMNHGARRACGELLLFLHADCTLEAGALEAARRCLRLPGVVACCFRQTVVADHRLYRAVDLCANLRVRLTGMAYGDQGLCIRRPIFEALAGFPELPLMEDVGLSRRLRRHGRLVLASKRIFVSSRRWRQAGIVRQTLRNWGLTGMAALGVPPSMLERFYPVVR